MFGVFPADEFQLYEAPVAAQFTATGAADVLLPLDPTRVIVCFSSTSEWYLLPDGGGLDPASGQGIVIGSVLGPSQLILDYTQHGPLVQAGWKGLNTALGMITVVTISLRRNPAMYGYRDLFHQPTATGTVAGRPLQRGAGRPGSGRRPVAYPRFLRERMAGILGEG